MLSGKSESHSKAFFAPNATAWFNFHTFQSCRGLLWHLEQILLFRTLDGWGERGGAARLALPGGLFPATDMSAHDPDGKMRSGGNASEYLILPHDGYVSMDRQQILLAKSLEAAGVPLQVDTFDERLILQKAVYLIQTAGVQTGYLFRWYLRGPYSPDMTADAFGIVREGGSGQSELARWSLDDESAKLLEKLKPLLARDGETIPAKARRLELLASVLFLINTEQTKASDSDGTSKLLKKNGKHFTSAEVREAVKELKGYGLA